MASEQDRIADGIRKVPLTMAVALVVVGFLMCLTIMLLPVGLIFMAAGGVWSAYLYGSATYRARHLLR